MQNASTTHRGGFVQALVYGYVQRSSRWPDVRQRSVANQLKPFEVERPTVGCVQSHAISHAVRVNRMFVFNKEIEAAVAYRQRLWGNSGA